jgi:dienelactone hydrolase
MERQVGGPPCASGHVGLQIEEGAPKMMASTSALLALLCFTLQACLGAQSNDGALASNSSPAAVPVEIVRPEGAGPFPAVVWMHSCAGVVRAARHMRDWTGRLVRLGYVVAIPDSFSPRGYHNGVCGYGALVPARLRADDAYAALRRVETLPNVRADKVGLIGHSHGGWTVLAAMDQETAAQARALAGAQNSFAAGIAFYPDCASGGWIANYHAAAPLLILVGELDDWTPSAPCQRLADWTRYQGQSVSIKVYPGALHSFDSYAPVTRIPEARRGKGATIGGNAEAREDSIREVEVFFGRYLKDSVH